MILHNKLEKPYEECTLRSYIWLQCDYCSKEFQRVKKSISRLNSIVTKDSCGAKNCTKLKQEDIAMIQYGTKHRFLSDEFKEKQKVTNLEKYGTEEYYSSDDFKEKRKKTLNERYGVDAPLQSKEIREKQQNTMEELYGVRNPSQDQFFLDKRDANNLEKYGVKHPSQLGEIKNKTKQTCSKKYNETSYVKTPEYWKRRKKTCLERYGIEHSTTPEVRNKAKQTCLEKYGYEYYSQTNEYKSRYRKTCLNKYGVPSTLSLQVNQVYGKTQKELQAWLNSYGFDFKKNYSLVIGREIDLYDSSKQLAIEYNGLFWHNEVSPNPRLRSYHYDKYIQCLQQGVRLITIFEDEWKLKQEQCKSVLLSILGMNQQNVYARHCKIIECSKIEFNQFCNTYHLQGSNNLGIIFYGLVYKNNLIGVMSLGRHPRNKQNLTLDRLCFQSGVSVIGGASKLFKQCQNWALEKGYQNIITWSDNRWSQGNVYSKLGFILDTELPPDYSYVDAKKPLNRISKQSQQKRITGCPPEKTEREFALENGLARIWDCGKKRWCFLLHSN